MELEKWKKVITALAASHHNTTSNLISVIIDDRHRRNNLQEQNSQLEYKLHHLLKEKEQLKEENVHLKKEV